MRLRIQSLMKFTDTQLRRLHSSSMTNSRYEYVKHFETDDRIIPNCWIVVRIDGKSFHKFCTAHEFEKPNDLNALNLMNHAAVKVMQGFPDIVISYGQSDEYSFVFHKSTIMYNRRSAKLMTNVNSLFTSSYVYLWRTWLGLKRLKYPPCFDARVVLYPSDENIKDYLSWRQADVHINNLYNTVFWKLVNSGKTNTEAEARLKDTLSPEKNEILFSEFDTNYNNLPALYRKGTILLRKKVVSEKLRKSTQAIIPLHEDMINGKFWSDHPEILTKEKPQEFHYMDDSIPKLVSEQIKSRIFRNIPEKVIVVSSKKDENK